MAFSVKKLLRTPAGVAPWTVACFTLFSALVVWFYGPVLRDPNGHVFATGGDGLKNYFTFAYHVANDSTWMDCAGVNHPYGELVFYTDGHPALSWLLQALPFTHGHEVGVLNTILLLGLVAYGMLVYALLRRFGLVGWAATAGAFGLTLLQPQIFRLEGHLALAHAWMLPLAWYLHLRARAVGKPMKWSIAVAALLVLAYFTHPYMGLMLSLFFGAAALLLALRSRQGRGVAVRHGSLQALLPLLLFILVLKAVDHHSDRPDTPNTGEGNLASVSGLCMPHHPSPLKPLTDLWTGLEPSWESWCYLGVATMAVLLISAIGQLVKWSQRNGPIPQERTDDASLYLGAGFIVLFFAMGLHKPLESFLPVLKQFRGAARFAWVFYLTAGIFSLSRLYGWVVASSSGRPRWGVMVFMLAPMLSSIEGWPHWQWSGEAIARGANPFNVEGLTDDQHALVDAARKEHSIALLPLPFEHSGSEVYQRGGPGAVFQSAYPMSYHTRTPVLAGTSSRTSLQETRKQFALLAPQDFAKPIASDLPAHGRIMLVWAGEPLDEDEAPLLGRATLVFENALAKLYMIDVRELTRCTGPATVEAYARGAHRIVDHHGWRVEWPNDTAELDTFRMFHGWRPDEHRTERVHASLPLFNFPAAELDTNFEYELDFVFREVDPGSMNIPIIWEHVLPDGTHGVWERMKNIRSMPMLLGDRVYATMRFRPKGGGRRNALVLAGRSWIHLRYAVDHVVLRRVDVHVWREEEAPGGTLVLRDNVPLNPEVIAPVGSAADRSPMSDR